MSSSQPWVLKADSAEVSQPEVPQLEPESSLRQGIAAALWANLTCKIEDVPRVRGGTRMFELRLFEQPPARYNSPSPPPSQNRVIPVRVKGVEDQQKLPARIEIL